MRSTASTRDVRGSRSSRRLAATAPKPGKSLSTLPLRKWQFDGVVITSRPRRTATPSNLNRSLRKDVVGQGDTLAATLCQFRILLVVLTIWMVSLVIYSKLPLLPTLLALERLTQRMSPSAPQHPPPASRQWSPMWIPIQVQTGDANGRPADERGAA
ncbi:hypothetical protein C8Q76DRAFT_803674 [Earliella scabrosa]|nr:hypothetical protein C8Q76DRAFT_803674 [Earliella scabrosa]